MKKTIILSLFMGMSLFAFHLFASATSAADDVRFIPSGAGVNDIGGCEGAAASSPVCTDLESGDDPIFGPDAILTRVANIFALVTGVISVFMITIGGLRYITSSGDASKTQSAKNTILYAAIGIAVASMAGLIANFILSRL